VKLFIAGLAITLLYAAPAGADESRWMVDGEYIYALPYACDDDQDYSVGQGYGGQYSHQGRLFYSLDFRMWPKTPVHAARGGVVQQVKEHWNEGGPDPKYRNRANLVRIAHADSTYAEYLHLAYQGVLVEEGQSVERGQLIAYSGMTGFTSAPHLHFDVTVGPGKRALTLGTRFHTRNGIETLAQGVDYRHAPEDCYD
jgi:murein DD-endopeptidase MepM/ murein hydrolase activator NlpD